MRVKHSKPGWIPALTMAVVLIALLPTPAVSVELEERHRVEAGRDEQFRPIRLPRLVRPGLPAFVNALAEDERVGDGVVNVVTEDPEGDIELTLTYDGVPGPTEWALIESLGGVVLRQFESINGLTLRVASQKADQLLDDPGLTQMDWDAPMGFALDVAAPSSRMIVENQTEYDTIAPGGVLEQITLPAAVTDLKGGSVTVAVIDSGVMAHPDLPKLQGCVDVVSVPQHLDVLQSTAALLALAPCGPDSDPFGHGTHVAGILGGSGASSTQKIYRGIAPDVRLISVRVLDDNGRGSVGDVMAGLEWVLRNKDVHGIDMVSMSFGGPFFVPAASDPLVQTVEALWNAGIVVVCSAGNFGREGNFTVTRPGNSSRVITVGALTDWNSPLYPDDLRSTFSSMGPTTLDGFLKPDLVAPGNRIVSLRVPGSALDGILGPIPGPDGASYTEMSGTSMAAPIVTAAAALMLDADPTLSPDTIKARLIGSAEDMPGTPLERGAGRLSVARALADTRTSAYAPSPRVERDAVCCDLYVEEIGGVWGAEWTSTTVWNGSAVWGDTALWSDSAVWGDTALWSDSAVWGDTALWSDSVELGD